MRGPVLLLRAPSVYPPQGDTWLLSGGLRAEITSGRTRVLDLCTGTGAVAVAAARMGASVTAVDISRRAVISTWCNSRARLLPVRARRGDLFQPVGHERFDLVVANPPYVPALDDVLPATGPARCWDAGTDGRAVLDRICTDVHRHLAPGGVVLVVFSALCGVDETLRRLDAAGLTGQVVARSFQAFGPVLEARAVMLEDRGLIEPGQRVEELVVVRGQSAA